MNIAPYKAVAIGLFRWSVFFVFAILAFAQPNEHTRTILIALVILLDVTSGHINQIVVLGVQETYDKQWFNTLTDRLILGKLLDRMRDGERIDFDLIMRDATLAAKADIQANAKDNIFWHDWSWWKKATAGTFHFLWFWISSFLFYGCAGFLGSALR